ncbi:antitoxin [Nanoarchaeota archaeon]
MVKTITIRDDVYKKLLEIKGDKSFSEIILELIEKKSNIKIFKDILKNSKILDEIEKEIIEYRKNIKSKI